ncbi:hypothetical protein [Streptomyces sp. NPDC005209]|uniref:hypothetical protein n=1 Tax=Streptomyces sp. NPDC005209 TaxID=3156715 RepID=UPI0033B78763
MELYWEIGSSFLEADTLRHLGDAHRAAGEPGPAREAWTAALALLEEGGLEEADEVRQALRELDP